MRVLIVAAPLAGHLTALLPLAAAVRAAGHVVAIATGDTALGVDSGGIETHDVTPGLRFGRVGAAVSLRHPRAAWAEVAGRGGEEFARHLFGALNRRMADPLAELVRRTRPDLVVYEPWAAVGALAAAAAGVPSVLLENGLFDGGWAARTAFRAFDGELPAPAAVVTVRPPSLGASPDHLPMRPATGWSGSPDLPAGLDVPGPRPRLLVSRSTVPGPGAGDPTRAVLAAADGLDADVVLVRPAPRIAAGPLPANVTTTGWIPLDAALPAATAIVHHGGAGTTLGALAAGRPQLLLPGIGDRRGNAEAVAAAGAGLAEPVRGITAEVLTRLLTDPALLVAAERVAAEIAAMPVPEDLVGPLLAFT
ncbi:glycosyltransferase [Pseudonocardia abyssalis]|uniref:Glycosyltransferase n=1 Tax=Pseudonocardia abyssalis TaxID=2792008 RepID=A0ABS6UW92_9PSEU|nr:nucleotide disphospho-sugar-binding domain-containing protein [Pseudonocardia abyssalis]MBW0116643.1 glycosyltransferase [Pseudonocardia abyssalis]MBW0136500.1 glycosyltransferase [Pseudonocardia abyssalis]